MTKRLFILIGPKGSGKTYIGSLIERELDIEFYRVEDVWLTLKEERLSRDYICEGFVLVEQAIEERFNKTERLIIESTAAHEDFHRLLARLKNKYEVRLIQVVARPTLCLERTRTRDQSMHIPISDNQVEEINRRAASVDLPFDLVIKNETLTEQEIVEAFSSLL